MFNGGIIMSMWRMGEINNSWHNDNGKFALDVVCLESGEWGWTVCFEEWLVDAGIKHSLEEAKAAALFCFRSANSDVQRAA